MIEVIQGDITKFEVDAIGPHIKVTLNGAVIVDANLDEIKQTAEMHDLNKHVGLHNTSGHIGFLGHGSHVEFRNVRIKNMAQKDGIAPEVLAGDGYKHEIDYFAALLTGSSGKVMITTEQAKESVGLALESVAKGCK